MAAFADAFKPVLPAAQDAVVPGLVVSKKRRKATVTLNRDGLAGLNENAASVVGSVTYARTRTDFFQDADDGEAMVCASLRADGFVFTDEEYADWWALKGHKLARNKAKYARYAVSDAVKEALWWKHGAPRRRTTPRR